MCWNIMTFQWTKWAASFDLVRTPHLIMTFWILLYSSPSCTPVARPCGIDRLVSSCVLAIMFTLWQNTRTIRKWLTHFTRQEAICDSWWCSCLQCHTALRSTAYISRNFLPPSSGRTDWVTNPQWRLKSRLLCNRDKYVPNWMVLRPRSPEI
jgi:hypothetical protein